jgi:hypothetical protein
MLRHQKDGRERTCHERIGGSGVLVCESGTRQECGRGLVMINLAMIFQDMGFIGRVRSPGIFWILASFVLVGIFGYWLAGTAAPRKEVSARQGVSPKVVPKKMLVDDPPPRFRKEERMPSFRIDEEAKNAGALAGQRILTFRNAADLQSFLDRAGDKVRLLGRLDELLSLRVGFLNPDDLAALLSGEEEMSLIFPVDLPPPGDASAQPGAVPLGAGLLEWLGIEGDNKAWGAGVRIAVLDTGVASHPSFSSHAISWTHLVDLPTDVSAQNGHGTAVASLIIGSNALTPGVAPGAEIVSIRIANDLGQSDSFLLAKGIIAAADAGVDLINISMGSFGDSALVRNAIEYARAAGSLIVAAAGNNGIERVTYPAANAGVIAVGAVDAQGNHLKFSNTGSQIAISAPGYGVNAAWTGDQAARVNGTSFSSPIVTGAIAAIMSQPGNRRLSAADAYQLLASSLNDGGQPGADAALGGGMPDLGRVLKASTPGIHDAALASQRILPPSPGYPNGQIEVLVQNRGTERLVNTSVQITTPVGNVTSNITTLEVNAVQTIRLPIPQTTSGTLRYDSKVMLSGGLQDAKPSNDRRVELYVPANAP